MKCKYVAHAFSVAGGTDFFISLAIFVAGLMAYTFTLAPTVLNGDAALFQYTPVVLGVTYPTGYPVYILLAKLWLALFPVGEIAWRMNLFSALSAALVLPVLYGVARHILHYRLAAVSSVLLFATLPTFWRWATEAKIYTLNILLFSIVLYLLTLPRNPKPETRNSKLGAWLYRYRFHLGALFLGLQLGVHSTTVLLLPGFVWLFWQNTRRRLSIKKMVAVLAAFVLPAALYLYIPLRGEWLIHQMGRTGAIRQGLLADFYHSGLSGWLRYFTAADFTGGVATRWGQVPHDLWAVYLGRLMPIDWGWAGVGWGFPGLAVFLLWQPLRRWAGPLILLFALPIPFVLTYGRGEQNAFLLTSNLIFVLFTGGVVAALQFKIQNSKFKIAHSRWIKFGLKSLIFLLIFILPIQHARFNLNWLSHKWDTSSRDYWADALEHPLEPDAGIMATWGDLTSMWYMQHVEHRRADLPGLYPPTEAVAADWLAQGKPLYIAGPVLDDWQPGVMERYQVIPWGRLVRLALPTANPTSLLPQLDTPLTATFGNRLQLRGAQFPSKIAAGGRMTVYLSWQALAELPAEAHYSLRLVQGENTIIAQKDDVLRPGWFPAPTIAAGQPLVGAYSVELPLGTLPGVYRLQLAVYHQQGQEWLLEDGRRVLELGAVQVTVAPPVGQVGLTRFGGEIALDRYEFGVRRVRQGKGYPVRFVWRALKSPAEDYTLLVEMVDRRGTVWRDWRISTATTAWRKNQQVRQQIDLVVPAEAPTGDGALSVRVRWLRGDGSRLPAQRWILPAGDSLTLGGPVVQPKENRQFERPPIAGKLIDVNFDDKLALVGFEMPSGVFAGAASLPLTLYWQGRGDMREVYAVFVHLLDAQGEVVAQHDGIPANGKQPTTSWAVGECIIDPLEISLPADLPPADYRVVVGLYLPATGARLPVLDGENHLPLDDFVVLGTVAVKNEE